MLYLETLDTLKKIIIVILFFLFLVVCSESKKECLEKGLYSSDSKGKDEWVVVNNLSSLSQSSMEYSTISDVSSASSSSLVETTDDASSSSAEDSVNGSLYDLSDLMTELPIKRGLSKCYQGKSESFTSLSRVTSVEDVVKKENPYKRRKILKVCKSYGGGLDHYKSYTLPKRVISKKSFKGGSFSPSFPTRNNITSFKCSLRPPLIPSQK